MEYLTTDNIAIYGAVVATLAFCITVLQYRFSIKDKKVQLKISWRKHPDFEQNMINRGVYFDGEYGGSGEAYIVAVINIGNVDAYINEIYGVSMDTVKHNVIFEMDSRYRIVSQYGAEAISPKAKKDYSIYFGKDNEISELKSCIVIDGTGKKWKGTYNG